MEILTSMTHFTLKTSFRLLTKWSRLNSLNVVSVILLENVKPEICFRFVQLDRIQAAGVTVETKGRRLLVTSELQSCGRPVLHDPVSVLKHGKMCQNQNI